MRTAREIGTSLARHIWNMVLSACVLFFGLGLHAQCPDFMDLTAPGVQCGTGPRENPHIYLGVNPNIHTIITQPGMDPYTDYQLPIIPPGESAVVKLGNDHGGKRSRGIEYSFTVDAANPILSVKYAVVIRHSGTFHPQGPFVRIMLTETDPELGYGDMTIYPCGSYCFDEHELDGHISGLYSWVPWRTLAIDLSDRIGQQIKLCFYSYDCLVDGDEFSYVYFTASCQSNHLTVLNCDGQSITLEAPSGCSSYEWNNGSTGQTATYSTANGLNVSCTMHSAHGCNPVLTNMNIQGLAITQGQVYYDTICQGESYHDHGFNLPPQTLVGTFLHHNLEFSPGDCSSGLQDNLYLTVLQRYIHHYDEVCEGSDYDNFGFHYTNLQPGDILDSIPLVLDNGCDSGYRYLHLTVQPTLSISGELSGEQNVCNGQVMTYSLLFSGHLNSYSWTIPDGIVNLFGSVSPAVYLYFTDESPNPATISVTAGNACGSHTFSKTIWHTPSYNFYFEDTLCTGSQYHGHGIHTAILDSAGVYYLSSQNTTVQGCDSNVVVRLVVGETPSVTTLADPAEICAGDTTTIHALGENAMIALIEPAAVLPGDILCTDSTIVKPEDWPVAGKTAKAVVFFVDSTGEHGWAVHLQEQGDYFWSTVDLPASCGIPASVYNLEPQNLLDGKFNTQVIRSMGNAVSYPAVWAVDFDHGWYLPAIGQLMLLFYELAVVNETLSQVNGTLFVPSSIGDSYYQYMNSQYWSSSPAEYWPNGTSIYMGSVFNISESYGGGNVLTRRVRSIIDF